MTSDVLAAFKADIEAIRSERNDIVNSIGDISDGVILRHKSSARWAFMLPDMTEPGRWRVQYFDESGFTGHRVRDTKQDIVEDTVREGFTVPDHEALDRLQSTQRFQRGNFIAGLIFQVNLGGISKTEGDRLLCEYDSKYGLNNSPS